MKIIKVKIEGTTPLLQHKMTEDVLFSLLGTKSQRKQDKEELSPREIAEKCSYKNEDGSYYVPSEYLMGAISHVAGDYKQKNSIRKSLKAIIKGIVRPTSGSYTIKTRDGEVVKSFEVDIRKATNHQRGAVIVCRPRFDDWSLESEIQIDDSLVSSDVLLDVFNDAGRRAGIGSFRVQRGGYFGQFRVTEWSEVKP